MNDVLTGRSFLESEYLAKESINLFHTLLGAGGWYAENQDQALIQYNDSAEELNQMQGIWYSIRTPFKTMSNTQEGDDFFKSHKVWHSARNGYEIDSYHLTKTYDYAYGQVPEEAFYNSLILPDEIDLEDYANSPEYRAWQSKYSAWFCMSDEAVSALEDKFAALLVSTRTRVFQFTAFALLALLTFAHLLLTCGRKPGSEKTHLTRLDRPWLDVSFVAIFLLEAAITGILAWLDPHYWFGSSFVFTCALFFCLFSLALYWVLSVVKHLKNRTFFQNTLCGTIFIGGFRIIGNIFRNWEVTAQVGLCAAFVAFSSAFISGAIGVAGNSFAILCFFGILCSGAFAFLAAKGAVRLSELIKGLKKLGEGDTSIKIPEKGWGFIRSMACAFNKVTDGLQVALQKAMRSERFKTELITNVSHDLRTPLTSIITYADLLQSEGADSPDAEKYVNIICQKAKRLKDLTEDLFEASKAASGEIKAELVPLDMMQLLSQSLGEMGDRLSGAQLDVRLDGEIPWVMADGRMMWRILENLLGNILKYAMPGTRVYINGTVSQGWAFITLRNVSKEPLPVNGDALTERFARGDEARGGEGSGLGLAIVKSFMELQQGQLSIVTDGDLFKVSLSLPLAEAHMDE